MSARPQFRLLGIPIRIEPLFWLVAVLLGYQLGDARLVIMWVAVVLVSVLVHELGHAVALKAFGQRSAIVLHGFGGLTFSQRRLSRGRSIVVSLAGSLTALVLLGVPARLVRDSAFGAELAADYRFSDQVFGLWPLLVFAAYVNIWWSLANLLPIRPLDGGNVLTELVGVQPARIASAVFGAGAAAYAYTQSTDFQIAGLFLGFLAFVNVNEWNKARKGSRGPSAFDVDGPDVPGGGGNRPGTPGPAGSAAPSRPPRAGGRPLGPPTRSGQQPPMAPAPAPDPSRGVDPASAESFAWNLLRRGDARGARRVLARATGPVGGFVGATVAVAEGGGHEPLLAAYRAAPGGPSNLVPAAVADDAGVLDDLVAALLGAGDPAGREAVRSIQTHLAYGERHAASARVGAALHAVDGPARAQTAFDVSCALARAGDLDAALGWVGRAIEDGFAAPRLLDGEPDLAAVRELPGWAAVRGRLDGA